MTTVVVQRQHSRSVRAAQHCALGSSGPGDPGCHLARARSLLLQRGAPSPPVSPSRAILEAFSGQATGACARASPPCLPGTLLPARLGTGLTCKFRACAVVWGAQGADGDRDVSQGFFSLGSLGSPETGPCEGDRFVQSRVQGLQLWASPPPCWEGLRHSQSPPSGNICLH